MPTDETRRLLKIFGVAVTSLEDAGSPEERARWAAEVAERLREIQALVDHLQARAGSA